MSAMVKTISTDLVMDDTAALLDFLQARGPAESVARVGLLGYCMSGPFVVAGAARFADRVAAAAAYYGNHLVTDRPDSPHLKVPQIKAELYFGFGEKDRFSPPDLVAALSAALKSRDAPYEVEIYPGADHAFAFPLRHAFDKASTERHWERMFSLFGRTL